MSLALPSLGCDGGGDEISPAAERRRQDATDEPAHQHEGEAAPADLAPSGRVEEGTRVVQVTAQRYEFSPNPIVVRQGEPVRLEVTSQDVTHGFGLDTFGIDRPLPPEETQTVEFVADEPGRHHIHCTMYCGPGHEDMHAELVVLPAD